jgi:hypothetical protein
MTSIQYIYIICMYWSSAGLMTTTLWGQAPPRIMVIWIRSNVLIRNL